MSDITPEQIEEMVKGFAQFNHDSMAVKAIRQLQAQVAAPEDNGIEELDALCAMYNRKEIDITGLVCRIWNNQQAKVAALEAALRHIAEGTWWDGNEPWEFHRVESYALAALKEEDNGESKC